MLRRNKQQGELKIENARVKVWLKRDIPGVSNPLVGMHLEMDDGMRVVVVEMGKRGFAIPYSNIIAWEHFFRTEEAEE